MQVLLHAGVDLAAASQRSWQQTISPSEPLAKRRAASVAVPAPSPQAQQPMLPGRRATLPVPASNRQLSQAPALPAPAWQQNAAARAAAGQSAAQQGSAGQGPAPWPRAPQHAQRQPAADVVVEHVPMVPPDGVAQTTLQQHHYMQQPLVGELSLAAGVAGQPAAAQAPDLVPAQPQPALLSMAAQQPALEPSQNTLAMMQQAMQGTAEVPETPRMQYRPSQDPQLTAAGAQGPAQQYLTMNNGAAATITSIITSARSSMDAAPLSSAVQGVTAPAMQQQSAEAGSQLPGMHQGEQRRPSTPTPEQGFTVYDNQLAAGTETVHPSGGAAAQEGTPPLDSMVSTVPDLVICVHACSDASFGKFARPCMRDHWRIALLDRQHRRQDWSSKR